VKIRGEWRYLCRAIDKHGVPNDFLLSAKRDLDAAKRFFHLATKDQPRLAPGEVGPDGASVYPKAISDAAREGLTPPDVQRRASKHLQQGIENGLFRAKKHMPKVGGFQTFATARRTITGFEAMLWLKTGFSPSPGTGRCAARTNCSRSVSGFKRLIIPENWRLQGELRLPVSFVTRPLDARRLMTIPDAGALIASAFLPICMTGVNIVHFYE